MANLRYFLVLWAFVHTASSARILAWFQFPAKSHHIAIQPLIRELAERGHRIDFYSAVPMFKPHKNIKEFPLPNAMELRDQQKDQNDGDFDIRKLGTLPVPLLSFVLYDLTRKMADGLKDTKVFKDLLNSNEKYDLVLGEFLFTNEDGTALIHKFKAPGVAIHPLGDCAWINELAGLPDNPAYMVDYKSLYSPGKMTFFQRLHNFYITTMTNVVSYLYTTFLGQKVMDDLYQYPGWETRPRLPMLVSDLALILVNSHHSVGYSFPKAPHVKEVAGISLQPTIKALPKDIQTFIDSAKDGVIYFSLGSVVDMKKMMEDGAFEAFLNVFKGLKQKVLWRWKNVEDFPKIDYPNIKFSTWFPQQDILAHNNTKLFITHGGLMSMVEAVNYGVPLVGMGVFGDQPKNVVRMLSAGFGVELDLWHITEDSVKAAVNEVLNNYPKYKTEVLRRQTLFRDRPMKPLDEAAYWVEYVLKHGNVLQPASARMPFYQLYLLDVISVLALSSMLVLWLFKKLLCSICSIFKKKTTKVSQSKKKR